MPPSDPPDWVAQQIQRGRQAVATMSEAKRAELEQFLGRNPEMMSQELAAAFGLTPRRPEPPTVADDIIPGTLVYNVSYGVRGKPGPMRDATVVIGGVDERNATTLDDIPRILSVAHLWGTEGASRIYIISLSLDFTRSDLS